MLFEFLGYAIEYSFSSDAWIVTDLDVEEGMVIVGIFQTKGKAMDWCARP